MIEKYGPVPEAILEPAESGESGGSFYSLYLDILESLGMARISRNNRPQACHTSQKVLKHAIDGYNADVKTEIEIYKRNVEPINSFERTDDMSAQRLLVAARFLKSPVLLADEHCKFLSYGDLYTDGVVYCELHGTLPKIRDELCAISGYTPKAWRERRNSIMLVLGIMLALLLALLAYRKATGSGIGNPSL